MEQMSGMNSLTLDEFRELSKANRVIPVARRLLADESTPVALYQKLTQNEAGTFLLESAENDKSWSRWSFIGVKSAAHLTIDQTGAHWSGKVPVGLVDHHDPVNAIRIALSALKTERMPDMPPLTGGLVGVLGYEFVRHIENLVASGIQKSDLPHAILLLTTDIAAVDHHSGAIWLIANAINFDNSAERVDEAYMDCLVRLDKMQERLSTPSELKPLKMQTMELDITTDQTDAAYEASVLKAKEHIYAGDAFQIVLSRKFKVTTSAEPVNVYRALRATNPSPYMYLFNLPIEAKNQLQIVGASPEALIKVNGENCMLHPIAGTRPRGESIEQDLQHEADLIGDEKERAEHLMLVDLGRNDLGRIAEPGSVAVTEFMKIERYSHVMHIVSTVTAKLAKSKSSLDALIAAFPAGTLSGAPKPRAMQLIDELEIEARDYYAGCIGYFDFAGNLDMAITIRTALIVDGIATVQAGAGIVADSDPKLENQECKNKASAVLRAISLAEGSYPV
jgi:anthranilate synthase component I